MFEVTVCVAMHWECSFIPNSEWWCWH